jgi:predicted DNA-binding protein YlxM (UPF0122 family)
LTDVAGCCILFRQTKSRCAEIYHGEASGIKTNRLNIIELVDYYSTLLTERQRSYLELYYNEDMSFAEIGEMMGITRAGAFDVINRARKKLMRFESRTGFVARHREHAALLREATSLAIETNADARIIKLLKEATDGI